MTVLKIRAKGADVAGRRGRSVSEIAWPVEVARHSWVRSRIGAAKGDRCVEPVGS